MKFICKVVVVLARSDNQSGLFSSHLYIPIITNKQTVNSMVTSMRTDYSCLYSKSNNFAKDFQDAFVLYAIAVDENIRSKMTCHRIPFHFMITYHTIQDMPNAT